MPAEIEFNAWREMTEHERHAAAATILKTLPARSKLLRLAEYPPNPFRIQIAEFEIEEARFNLVPGGDYRIGFDAAAWEPSADELHSWEETAEEYSLDPSPIVHLREITNGVRTVRIPAMLVEVTGSEYGWKRISSDDARVRKLLKDHPAASTITAHQHEQVIRVQRMADGQVVADEQIAATHQDLVRQCEQDGFRLASSNEWEFLCGAGEISLFRWGDHVPCDRYPTDISPAEADWRRHWALSGGTLDYPSTGFLSDWDFHRQPNSLGLTIAHDPYKCELVAEPDILRGGDGGAAICGGIGFFAGWLPLATAYFEEYSCKRSPNDPIDAEYILMRRVLEL